jgi:hypothetical protein
MPRSDSRGLSALLGGSLQEGFGFAQGQNDGNAGPWLGCLCDGGEVSGYLN